MWLNKPIRVGITNQFGTNTCHHNKKLDQILSHLHIIWDFPESPINEYSGKCMEVQQPETMALHILVGHKNVVIWSLFVDLHETTSNPPLSRI